MSKRDDELDKLEKIAESFTTMGNFARVLRETYTSLENHYEDINSRLAQVNESLRYSLEERNRLAHYLSNILDSLESAVIVTDPAGVITVFNATAEKYTQISSGSALGQRLDDVIELGYSDHEIISHLQDKGSLTGNFILNSGNCRSMPLAYTLTKLRRERPDDQPGMVLILHNLSEIRKLENDLKQVSTLAALGEMAATVAHEIRNPLAGMAGFAALLLRDLKKDDPSRRLVEKINQGIISLDKIVASLLDYTRNISPAITDVDVVSVVNEAVSDLKAAEEARAHNISIDSGSRELRARLDPQLFRMVVFNLVKNAMQARPDGGNIRLTLKRGYSGELNLMVEDNGPGIPDEAFDKLFTPFYTTKADGTGLGLATVKKLIELHGGRVKAQNSPAGGARFIIEIPDHASGVSGEA